MEIVYVDVETGGRDPSKHPILEIALGYGIEKFHSTVLESDELVIEPEAFSYNGFNLSYLQASLGPANVTSNIMGWIGKDLGIKVPITLCGWNTAFDASFIHRLYMLAGYSRDETYDVFHYRTIDLYSVAKFLSDIYPDKFPEKITSHECFQHFGCYEPNDEEKRHTALYDMRCAQRLHWAFQGLFK